MRNAFYSRMRIQSREGPARDDDCAATAVLPVDPKQHWSCLASDVRHALDCLPAHHREVIVLVTLTGLGYREAADACGCDIGTIKSRLFRARQSLLFLLGETTAAELICNRDPVWVQ